MSQHVHESPVADLESTNGAGGLPTIPDPFDTDTHARLDAEVIRKTGGDPGTDDVALYNLLSYIDYDIKAAVLRDEDGGHLDTSISIMLESRPALRALLRSSLEHESFKNVRLLEYLWPPRMNRSSRWVTISFIRHAQCFGNVNGPHISNADMLTPLGETQAKALGRAWMNTRIDSIHCSTLNRAKRTANAVATAHTGIPTKPPVHATRWLVERNAPARPKRRGAPIEGHEHLSAGPGHHAHEEWRDEPPDGVGETYAEVAARGVHYLLCLFAYHAAVISQPPPGLTELSEDRPEDVPEGIPHIVVVAHNFILCELYEALISWNDDGHTASNADFAQTGWSRHVLCLHGGERDGPGLGGRARLYGRLEQTILRHPDEFNPALCSPGESPNSSPQLLTTPSSTPRGTPHSSGVASVCVDIPLIAA